MLADYRGKKVLVTGHTGFKGSWLSQWLLDLGADVCGYSNEIPTQPAHFAILQLETQMQHCVGDVRNFIQLGKVFREFQPEMVFHLAAQSLVRQSYDEPKVTFDTNLGGTVNVLECIRQTPSVQAAVIVATDKCYENREQNSGYREDDRLGGSDPYSASKACAEIAFISYQKSFFANDKRARVASARAGNVIGGGDWAADRIVPDCVRAWSRQQAVTIRNPEAVRPWQHVLEPLSGYLLLGENLLKNNPAVVGQSFNFGPNDDSSQTVSALLTQMQSHWPSAIWEVKRDSSTKKETQMLLLNCEKAKTVLKWQSRLTFADAVNLTFNWYRAFAEGQTNLRDLTKSQIHEFMNP